MICGENLTVRFIEYMPLGDAALLGPPAPSALYGGKGWCEAMRQGTSIAVMWGPPWRTLGTSSAISRWRTARSNVISASAKADANFIAADEIGPAGGCGAQDRGVESLVSESEVRAIIENHLGLARRSR